MSVNKDYKAFFLVDKEFFYKKCGVEIFKVLDILKKNEIVNDVFYGKLYLKNNNSITDISSAEEYCLSFYNKMFDDIGVNLEDFDEYVLTNDTWEGWTNLYFNLKKIKYKHLVVLKNKIGHRITSALPGALTDCINKYEASTPYADYAKPVLLSDAEQKAKDYFMNKDGYEEFDSYLALMELDSKCVETLLNAFFYDIDILNYFKQIKLNSVLFLPNSNGRVLNTAMKPIYTNHETVYQWIGLNNVSNDCILSLMDNIAFDYYISNKSDAYDIYLKTHPNSPKSELTIRSLYNRCHLINNIPFEILYRYLIDKSIRFTYILGYSSTASYLNFNEITKKSSYSLGDSYLNTWFWYDSIFITLNIINDFYSDKEVYSFCNFGNIDNIHEQFELLNKEYNFSLNTKRATLRDFNTKNKNCIYVVDCMSLKNQKIDIQSIIESVKPESLIFFLNIDFAEMFVSRNFRKMFSPIYFKKEYKSDCYRYFSNSTTIWFYSINSDDHKKINSFKFSRHFDRQNADVEVKALSINETINCFTNYYNKYYLSECVENQSAQMKYIINKTNEVYSKYEFDNVKLLEGLLKNENNIHCYLKLLSQIKNKTLVVLSIKDTPGNFISDAIISELKNIGFNNFKNESHKMYIGIIYNGKVIIDKLADKPYESLNYTLSSELENISLIVSSQAWGHGNKSEIVINDVDYSLNSRGLNIVTYNVDNNAIIDSISYDYNFKPREVFKHGLF